MTDTLNHLVLLPRPHRIDTTGGVYTGDWKQVDESIEPADFDRAESYTLELNGERVTLAASDSAGLFYGRQTLAQLKRLAERGLSIPNLRITDRPDFAVRGVMIDISRDKVPTMATLRQTVGLFSSMKINQLQLYTEHTFAYTGHEDVWRDASPMTADQVRELDAWCRAHHIELVPNQNTFGHMERWLKHDRYRPLAECADGWIDALGRHRPAGTLNPTDPKSLQLIEAILPELIACHSSKQINVGGDETYELGQGRSKAVCKKRGNGAVYHEYLLGVQRIVKQHGCTMQFWGDIVLEHPELVAELPRDLMAMVWGYEADHPFDEQCAQFVERGVPYCVCPGASSWNTIAGRTDNMLTNISSAVRAGLEHGAAGVLTTDWGDNGHWQTLPIAWPGYAWAAAESWSAGKMSRTRLAAALDIHVLGDRADVTGDVLLDLGNVYQTVGATTHNASVLARAMYEPESPAGDGVTHDTLAEAKRQVTAAIDRLDAADITRPDGKLILEEVRLAGAMLRHACDLLSTRDGQPLTALSHTQRAALANDLEPMIAWYQTVWLARNREGGLIDSAGRLRGLLNLYRAS